MLCASERQLYQAFVTQQKLPVFYATWYLDAVCGNQNWDCIFAHDKDGSLAAIWPFHRKNRLGGLLKTLDKPAYCMFFGPWVSGPKMDMNPAKKLSRYNRLLQQLAEKLPEARLKRAYLPYEKTNTLALSQIGWESRLYHSYQLPTNQQSSDKIWQRFGPKLRHDLKAYSQLKERIKQVDDIALLLKMDQQFSNYKSTNSLRAKDGKLQSTLNKPLSRLLGASEEHQAGIGWLFFNANEVAIAGIWLVFDKQSAYMILAVSDPTLRSEEKAVTQLIWHAIQWACNKQLTFDFEGSSLVGVEAYYRSWGPIAMSYIGLVWKQWKWLPV